jgi:DNA-binding NarL/FixJ family response regulator
MTIRVLLADDHSVLRDGLAALLGAQDRMTVVAHAQDGREAVRKATELKPDVVIMDIVMPELDGIEATRLVRKSSPLTQVVILSMYSTTQDRRYLSQPAHAEARSRQLRRPGEVRRRLRLDHSLMRGRLESRMPDSRYRGLPILSACMHA